MSDDYTKNTAIFPTEEVIAKCEPSIYLGEAGVRLRDEAWTRIQAA
jgi:spermidine/putrescine transport system substrate-binding protein